MNLSKDMAVANHFPSYSVIIVGAGMAGFGAARTLIEAGVENILILEAQDHAGGRVMSLPLREGWVEAGAQWIHGEGSAVWELANEFDLLAEYCSSEGEGPYIREDGVIFEPKLVFEVDKVVSDILEECEQFCKKNTKKEEVPLSVGDYLQVKFQKYLDSCLDDSVETRTMKEELFDWHIRFQIIDNSSPKLDTLSAQAWGNYAYCGGTDYINFVHGYSSLVDKLSHNLPTAVLRLNTPVTHIQWQRNISGIHNILPITGKGKNYCPKSDISSICNDLTIEDNSASKDSSKPPVVISCGNGLKLVSQHCIVTSSLGFLKEHCETMFEPSLPQSLLKSIQDMGFATINKIYLDFQQPWWTPDTKGFQLIWSKNSNCANGPHGWLRDLTGFDVLPNLPGVLLGWIGGKGAEQVEGVSEREIGQQCTDLLRRFTRGPDIPEPRGVIRTRWNSNPFVRGGYSHTTNACDALDTGPVTLAQPVLANIDGKAQYPVILLAGEAAHERYFSTTHGAFESGQRQANVILKYHGIA